MAQALIRRGATLDFLDQGIRETINKRYSSEVEVVGEGGSLVDVIYSGAETTTATTTLGSGLSALNASTIRSRVEMSNEDATKTTTESIDFEF
jgi:hypothetical protein